MACQTMARFFSSRLAQLGAIYAHLMVPGLNSGRLAVYSTWEPSGFKYLSLPVLSSMRL